jgi:Uma2 family endonuclease
MATQPNQQRMSAEEFFEVCRKHPEGRFEYIHGYMYHLMAGGDSNHSLTKVNLNRELSNALRGGPCFVYDSDMHVRIADDLFVLPDASVSCDERDHGIVKALTYPCLVIEVLSPSTRKYDQVQKLAYYGSVPSIKEYMVVSTNEKLVVVHRRQQNESWIAHLFRTGTDIELTGIGVSFSIEALYERVTFPRITADDPREN